MQSYIFMKCEMYFSNHLKHFFLITNSLDGDYGDDMTPNMTFDDMT